MTLQEITIAANAYTDENFGIVVTRVYADEAIAEINTELKSKLPYFPENVNASYTALDEQWLRSFVIPYMAYSIKMNDGSLNEADRFLVRAQKSLYKLKKNKRTAIAEAYRDTGFLNGYKISQHKYMETSVVGDFRDVYKGDK